jgi:hypothetical protein
MSATNDHSAQARDPSRSSASRLSFGIRFRCDLVSRSGSLYNLPSFPSPTLSNPPSLHLHPLVAVSPSLPTLVLSACYHARPPRCYRLPRFLRIPHHVVQLSQACTENCVSETYVRRRIHHIRPASSSTPFRQR